MRRDKQSPLKHFFHETNCKTYYFFSNYYILLPLLLEKKVEVSHTQTSSKNKKIVNKSKNYLYYTREVDTGGSARNVHNGVQTPLFGPDGKVG